MSDDLEIPADHPVGDLREVTLRIPGELFFCETVSLPASLDREANAREFPSALDEWVRQLLDDPNFSPYPAEQLAWGIHLCENSGRIFVFAAPLIRLRQLGWQNLEFFRRVFPSFVSLLGEQRERSQAEFLLCGDTLSIACFEAGSSAPSELLSLPVEAEDEDSVNRAKARLLAQVDAVRFEVLPDTRIAGEVHRADDGSFVFDHRLMQGESEDGEDLLEDSEGVVRMGAEELWRHDLRPPEFKVRERSRRRQERSRWKALKISALAALLLACCFVGLKIAESRLLSFEREVQEMARQVPLVLDSQKLLEKLRQNKLGGIDPFLTINRVAEHRGGNLSSDDPAVWFSKAHFETRNQVKLEGEGKNVAAVNDFIGKLESLGIARIRTGRSGDEKSKIKSGGGKTTFEVELEMSEESPVPESPNSGQPG